MGGLMCLAAGLFSSLGFVFATKNNCAGVFYSCFNVALFVCLINVLSKKQTGDEND